MDNKPLFSGRENDRLTAMRSGAQHNIIKNKKTKGKKIMDTAEIKVGQKIKVKCATRWGWVRGWRVVNGKDQRGFPTIRCGGWANFIVHPHEIQEVR